MIKWLPKDLWIVIIGMVLLYTGLSFIWPFNMIYMTQELGMSTTDASLVLLINSGVGIVSSIIGGIIFDRFSGFISLTIGTIILVLSTYRRLRCAFSMDFHFLFGIYGRSVSRWGWYSLDYTQQQD